MTNTAGAFAIPSIVWGNDLENALVMSYPLYDWVTRSEALDGSQFLRIESGEEDAWIVNTSYVLEATIRFITQEQWDTDWIPFLEWARQKNTFEWYPDIFSSPSEAITSYLIQPITESPTIEPDGTRTIRLVIRNSTTAYENVTRDKSYTGTLPINGLVLNVNNSIDSYPGTGNTWYDISGNDIDLIITGSPSFNRDTGFTLNVTGSGQYFYTQISSSLGSYFSSSTLLANPSGSLCMVVAMQPVTLPPGAAGYNVAGLWDASVGIGDNRRYKFNLDVNPIKTSEPTAPAGTLEAAAHYNPNEFTNVFTRNNALISTGSENIIMYQLTSTSQSVVYNNLQEIGTGSFTGSASWYNADPPFYVGAGRLSSGVFTSFFSGSIRAVMIYNRQLSNIERKLVYNYLTQTL